MSSQSFTLILNVVDDSSKDFYKGICRGRLAFITIDARKKGRGLNPSIVFKFAFKNDIIDETERIYVSIPHSEIYESFDLDEWLLYIHSNIYKFCKEENFELIASPKRLEKLVQQSLEYMQNISKPNSSDNTTHMGFKKETK